MTDFTKRALRRISPIYENSRFLKSLFDAENFDWEILFGLAKSLNEQPFTETVTWNIETLERKYSLEPRPDLSLEERRARLKIRVAKKYPLNPAVLEKYALDTYGLKVFLDESEAGYIRAYLNRANENLADYFSWLLEEKPAHLSLCGRLIFIDFIGGGVFEPSKVVTDPEEIIPRTDEERKNFPRTFFGVAQTNIGLKIIDVGRPRDIKQTVRSGAAIVGGGKRTISLGLPRILLGNEIRRTLGMAYVRRGDITIEAYQGDLPKHEDLIESAIADLLIANVGIARAGEIKIPVETYDRAFRLNSFGGAGLNVFGAKKLDLPRPRDQRQKFFTGIGLGKLGGVTLKTLPEVRTRTKIIMRAGATLYKTGKITIESFDKPSPPPEHRALTRVDNLNTKSGSILVREGYTRINHGTQLWRDTYKILMRAGAMMIRRGTLRIESVDDFFDVPEGDWLKLWFKFPSGASKIILLQNPRDDLTKELIRQLGDFAAADEILINEKGDTTVGISRAALISRSARKIF